MDENSQTDGYADYQSSNHGSDETSHAAQANHDKTGNEYLIPHRRLHSPHGRRQGSGDARQHRSEPENEGEYLLYRNAQERHHGQILASGLDNQPRLGFVEENVEGKEQEHGNAQNEQPIGRIDQKTQIDETAQGLWYIERLSSDAPNYLDNIFDNIGHAESKKESEQLVLTLEPAHEESLNEHTHEADENRADDDSHPEIREHGDLDSEVSP